MRSEVRGTRLWFDVDGPAPVPDGPTMRERPTVVLLHGGPGSFDHSYSSPTTTARFDLGRLVEGFRRAGGDEVAAIAERVYGGDSLAVTAEERARCWRLFGP